MPAPGMRDDAVSLSTFTAEQVGDCKVRSIRV